MQWGRPNEKVIKLTGKIRQAEKRSRIFPRTLRSRCRTTKVGKIPKGEYCLPSNGAVSSYSFCGSGWMRSSLLQRNDPAICSYGSELWTARFSTVTTVSRIAAQAVGKAICGDLRIRKSPAKINNQSAGTIINIHFSFIKWSDLLIKLPDRGKIYQHAKINDYRHADEFFEASA